MSSIERDVKKKVSPSTGRREDFCLEIQPTACKCAPRFTREGRRASGDCNLLSERRRGTKLSQGGYSHVFSEDRFTGTLTCTSSFLGNRNHQLVLVEAHHVF